jgi:uncharacterized protein (DUF362 family)
MSSIVNQLETNRNACETEPGERLVVLAESYRTDYGALATPVLAPELEAGEVTTVAAAAVRELFRIWGLDASRYGSIQWNPLSVFISPGSKVVLKPNWVLHWNKSGSGMDCLVTHSSIVEAVLEYVALTRPGSVVVGDSPVQGCDFEALRQSCGVNQVAERFRARGMNINICDFRRTVLPGGKLGRAKIDAKRGIEKFVLFDLKEESLLEPLASDARRFRVTMYDPDLMLRTHSRGRHHYLVAREIIEADTVINLPKLKTHKKACLTGALKNVVGINGHKEYLPHHRKGGTASGGDCYEGRSSLKGIAENMLDAANRSHLRVLQVSFAKAAAVMLRAARFQGQDGNLEGSWYGNDTVWRTCLDLQRILRFGLLNGKVADIQQRRVISITDAIVAGEGEGPLSPTPFLAGYVTGATNPAAAEWAHARLMGFDPHRIPLVEQAFSGFTYSLADFAPSEVILRRRLGDLSEAEISPIRGRSFEAAQGWKGHCEFYGRRDT